MAKKKWHCHNCAYNNNGLACDAGNDSIFMTGHAYTCKDYEKYNQSTEEKSNVTPLLPSPAKPKIKYTATDEVVYAFHD